MAITNIVNNVLGQRCVGSSRGKDGSSYILTYS